jgi:DNA-directed RNA polymerase subunit RPC12/RpoP
VTKYADCAQCGGYTGVEIVKNNKAVVCESCRVKIASGQLMVNQTKDKVNVWKETN